MKAVLEDGRRVRLSFLHTQPPQTRDKWTSATMWRKSNGITLCEITTEEGVTVATGEASCSKGDQYRKETGRLKSLRRATEGLSKADRKVIWDAYTNRREGEKRNALLEQATGTEVV